MSDTVTMSVDSQPLLELFDAPSDLIDRNIISYEEVSFQPDVYPLQSGAPESVISLITRSSALDTFMLIGRSYLEVQYKLQKDATDAGDTTAVAGIVGGGWSLFNKAQLELNNATLEQIELPGMVAHVNSLLKRSRQNILNADVESYYPPIASDTTTGAHNAGTEPQRDRAVQRLGAYGAGYQNRVGHLRLPLDQIFGFCMLDKAYRGCQFRLTLTLESVMARILAIADTSTVGFSRVTNINWVVPTIKPSAAQLLAVNNRLVSESIPLRYETIYTRVTDDTATGLHELDIVVGSAAKRPIMVICAMQKTARRNRAINGIHPLVFDNLDVERHHILVNGKMYPQHEFQGKKNGYIREYNAFLKATNKTLSPDSDSWADFKMFKELYPLWVYDCSYSDADVSAVSGVFAQIQHRMTYNPGADQPTRFYYFIVSQEYKTLTEINGQIQLDAPSM